MHVATNKLGSYPLEYSHYHARGLRRDLFRQLHAEGVKYRALYQLLKWHVGVCKGKGERRRLFNHLGRKMSQTFWGHEHERSGPTHQLVQAVYPSTCELASGTGVFEAIMLLSRVSLGFRPGQATLERRCIAALGQHAIERMFQRMNTTSLGEVLGEITSASSWMLKLHAACQQAGQHMRLRQMLIPTTSGALLCQRDPGNGLIMARTWIRPGGNTRIDTTLAALHAWSAVPSKSTTGFSQLLARPENRWLLQPYQAAASSSHSKH